MKTQTVWKILHKHSKKLFSASGIPTERKVRSTIRYFTNRVNKPRKDQHQFLFCFESLSAARNLLDRIKVNRPYEYNHFTIYEAEATDVSTTATLNLSYRIEISNRTFDMGTLFAKSLKLTKRIK